MTSIILDCESNGLLDTATKIWCICIDYLDSDEPCTFSDYIAISGSNMYHLNEFVGALKDNKVTEIIGHNIIAYDIPLLTKLLGIDFTGIKLTDTLVISRRLDPDRDMKRHDLASWGRRMGGEQKVVQEQWSTFEPNMITRCQGDVRLTRKVYNELMREIKRNNDRAA